VLSKLKSPSVLYAYYVDGKGIALYQRACQIDLEGVVAKHRRGHYTADAEASTWFKIRNRNYSQWAGRNEAFVIRRREGPACRRRSARLRARDSLRRCGCQSQLARMPSSNPAPYADPARRSIASFPRWWPVSVSVELKHG
jgi:hypothetical protein